MHGSRDESHVQEVDYRVLRPEARDLSADVSIFPHYNPFPVTDTFFHTLTGRSCHTPESHPFLLEGGEYSSTLHKASHLSLSFDPPVP